MMQKKQDQDAAKGATESEDHKIPGNKGLQEQLGHRDQDPMLKDADSDFPEPGENPEHTGEPQRKKGQALPFSSSALSANLAATP
jgi:hypothetical protein